MATFTQPTPPIDFRRDIEAFNLYHKKCTTKPIQETVGHLLYALENTEPIVDRTDAVYTKFRNAMVGWKTRIDKKHDADANRWYFHRMGIEFRAIESLLYDVPSDLDRSSRLSRVGELKEDSYSLAKREVLLTQELASDSDSALEGDTEGENPEDGDHDDESTDDDESDVGQEEDTPAVAQSESSTDTHADVSTRIDETRDGTVAEKTLDMPSPKTKTKPSARGTRFSQRLKDLDALRTQEEENMHHSPRREKGKEFRGGPVDPKKAHLDIGEREIADQDEGVVLAELESNVRGAA